MIRYEREGPRLNPLDLIRVVNRREGDLLDAFVPAELLYTEDVPVEEDHVQNLKRSILAEEQLGKTNGQLMPLLLGHIPGFDQFPIADGFHRAAALKELGKPEIFATIRPNCTWKDIVDLRILSAATHKSVKFARLIEWVEQAWGYTNWVKQIKVQQAFALRSAKGMTGRVIGLTLDQANEVREWVDKNCELWHLSPGYVYRMLSTAQVADPELVKETRARQSGHTLEKLTPEHLAAVAKALPLKYSMQRFVAQEAISRRLTVAHTRLLAEAVSQTRTVEEAHETIEAGSWMNTELPSVQRERKVLASLESQRRESFTLYLNAAEEYSKRTGKPVVEVVGSDFAHAIAERASTLHQPADTLKSLRTEVKEEDGNQVLTVQTPFGELHFFPARQMAISPLLPEGTIVHLTRTESAYLERLMSDPAGVHSHVRLVEAAYAAYNDEIMPAGGEETLTKGHIRNMRQKLGDNGSSSLLIHAMPNRGYTLVPNPIEYRKLPSGGNVSIIFEVGKLPPPSS